MENIYSSGSKLFKLHFWYNQFGEVNFWNIMNGYEEGLLHQICFYQLIYSLAKYSIVDSNLL